MVHLECCMVRRHRTTARARRVRADVPVRRSARLPTPVDPHAGGLPSRMTLATVRSHAREPSSSQCRAVIPLPTIGTTRPRPTHKEIVMIAVDTMRATVFHAPEDIRIEEVDRPRPGPGEALIRITLTTICGTDVHIVGGESPVRPGLVLGHEPVGVIEELGAGVTGYEIGDRVLVGAITPCGQCHACLSGHLSQCGHGTGHEAIGGWRVGDTINGAQAEELLLPAAQADPGKGPGDLPGGEGGLLGGIAATRVSGGGGGGG